MKSHIWLSIVIGTILAATSCTPTDGDPQEYVYYDKGSGIIGTKGGEIYIADENSSIRDAVCSIKAGALTSPLTFTLKKAPDNIIVNGRPEARIIDVQPSNVDLAVDAVIGLSYLHLGDVNLNSLQIYRLIPSTQELIPLSKPNADQTKKVFYGTTPYLGYFVLLPDDAPDVTTGTFEDGRDQQSYDWVEINGQKWMAENLNFATTSGSWCYNENSSNCATYGRLYDINTARSVCPPGWRLPSHEDWQELEAILGLTEPNPVGDTWQSQGFVGKKLKATSGWSSSGNGTDLVRFKALPAGYRDGDGTFHMSGETARFWTTTPVEGDFWARFLMFDDDGIYWGKRGGTRAYSVRCIEGVDESLPSVNATAASSITGFTADLAGNVVSQGNSTVTERGFCWNTSGYPQVEDNHIAVGSGPGAYSTQINGLVLNTRYYVRAYAINNDGIGYSQQYSFSTKGTDTETKTFTDTRDQRVYDMVRIGSVWWMADNLNYYTASGSWCYADQATNCSNYGRLYDHNTAKTICPPGMQLPGDEDWKAMEIILGMSTNDANSENWRHDGDIGLKLKSTSGWFNDGNGNNSSRMNIKPSGFRDGDGTYSYLGMEARFWTATIGADNEPWVRYLEYTDSGVYRNRRGVSRGMAVRCIQK